MLLLIANEPFGFEGFGDDVISGCECPLSSIAAVQLDADMENDGPLTANS